MVNKPSYKFLLFRLKYMYVYVCIYTYFFISLFFFCGNKKQGKGGLIDFDLYLGSLSMQVHYMYIVINSSYS